MQETLELKNSASWTDVTTSKYVKFDEDVRKTYAITNWKLFWVEQDNYAKTGKEKRIKLTADVVGVDGKIVKDYVISNTSKRFIEKMRRYLENKSSSSVVFLSIKKIGKDKNTAYDIESVEPTPLV